MLSTARPGGPPLSPGHGPAARAVTVPGPSRSPWSLPGRGTVTRYSDRRRPRNRCIRLSAR